MSFLQKEINLILTEVGQIIINEGKISSLMDSFRQALEDKLNILHSSDDLRVFDNNNGGALRGPKNSRKKYENFTSQGIDLLCDAKYMTHGKDDQPSEVPYMRGLFNARSIGSYEIIAYETPLMRKKDKKKNPAISGRALACDLLGIDKEKKEICCIEVKTVPDLRQTFVPYALLEGFAYAFCLDWILKKCPAELANEMKLCCDESGSMFSSPQMVGWNVTFAIAAPYRDYFAPYVQKNSANQSREWFNRRFKEVAILEQHIKSYFAGYFVIDQHPGQLKKEPVGNVVKPYFESAVQLKQIISQLSLIK